jgi:hypothetical protein
VSKAPTFTPTTAYEYLSRLVRRINEDEYPELDFDFPWRREAMDVLEQDIRRVNA